MTRPYSILTVATLLAFGTLPLVADDSLPPLGYFDVARPTGEANDERTHEISFPLQLRIGLMEKQSDVALTCRKPFQVRYGDRVKAAPANQKWTFKIRRAEAAQIEYAVAVRTLPWHEREAAETEAAGWHERGFEGARVATAGARMTCSGRVIHDNRRHFVIVGSSIDKAEAEDLATELRDLGDRPFLVEKLHREPEGIIEARSSGGAKIISRGPFEIWTEDPSVVHVFQVEFGVGYPWHGRQDRDFSGSIIIMVDRWGKLVAINRVELEKYLKGVVPSEIEANAPPAAQKTQAVSARGETLSGYGVRHPSDPYDFDATQRDQVYGGITKETPVASAAVNATRGQVLKAGEEIVETVYSANCGGHTENNEVVWSSPPDPQLRGVADAPEGAMPSPVTGSDLEAFLRGSPDAYCRIPGRGPKHKYRWDVTFTAAQLDAFAEKAGLDIGRVMGFELLERGRSGRLRSMKVLGESGTARIDKELPIRRFFGGLRSALFIIEPGAPSGGRPDSFTFTGGGWGHGVGMCQMGARGMAQAGKSYAEILKKYFSETELVGLYD